MLDTFLKYTANVYGWFASKTFFVVSLVYFAIHSLWVILSSNLLPYDEYYHIAIIKQYAFQWSPFVSSQPVEGVFYGDITRLHSYLYHYLMSFPYRFLDFFIESETVIIILLRLLNLAMVIGGIILFRRLFLKSGISQRAIHVAIALFVATPFVVILASQNNYDNLMFLLSPLFFMFAYNIISKPKTRMLDVAMFLSIGMMTSLVKHGFTLVFALTGLFILITLYKQKRLQNIFGDMSTSISSLHRPALIAVGLLFVLSTGLFIERHGINLYRYGSINVNCAKVQPVEVCQNYSPWRRNDLMSKIPPETERYGNPLSFTQHWVATIMSGLYANFANIIPKNIDKPDPYGHYVFHPLLWLPVKLGYTALILFVVALVLYRKKRITNKLLKMLAVVSFGMLVVLFLFNYRTYLRLGRAYAIQVRYMFPLLLPVFLIVVSSLNQLMQKVPYKKQIAVITLLLYMVNGGAAGWIIRSDASWYWDNQTIVLANQALRGVLTRFILH